MTPPTALAGIASGVMTNAGMLVLRGSAGVWIAVEESAAKHRKGDGTRDESDQQL